MLQTYPTAMEVYDAEDDDRLMARVTMQDEACSAVEIIGACHTPESWEELAQAIHGALKVMHPKESS